jgi:hypothetical protein
MNRDASIRRSSGARLRAALLAAVFLAPVPFIPGAISPVHAQVGVRAEFHDVLAPYGQWEHHARWGDVWIPHVSRNWRPYTVGRWAYTNDWGWYWVSDTPEEAWGWVVFHYGRWIYDDDWGWAWVPGNEWAPAWVSWRRGARYIGWEPLPPEQIVVEYSSQPDYWIFCRASDFIAPDIVNVIVPVRETDVFFRQTVVVNRTYDFRNYGYAVDTGIEPNVVAAFVGHTIHAFDVRPVVLAGTARIPGAYEVRGQEMRAFREGRRPDFTHVALRETTRTIGPANHVPPPHALAAGEHGRLGENPPLAARGTAALEHQPQTQGRGLTPEEQRQGHQPFGREHQANQQQGNRGPGNRVGRPPSQPGTEGRGPGNEGRPGRHPRGNENAFGHQTGREFGHEPGHGAGRGGPGPEQHPAHPPQFGQANRGPHGEQGFPGTEGGGRGAGAFETHHGPAPGPRGMGGRGGNAREFGPGPQQGPRFGGAEHRGGGPQFGAAEHRGGPGPRFGGGGGPGGGAAFARGGPGGPGPRGAGGHARHGGPR